MLKSLILAVAGCAVLGIASCDAPTADDTAVSTPVHDFCEGLPINTNPQDEIALQQCFIRLSQARLDDPGEPSDEQQNDESALADARAQLAIWQQKASGSTSPAPAAEPAVAQTINVNGFTATPPEPPSGSDAKVKKIRDCFYPHIADLNKAIQNDKLNQNPETVAITIKQDYAATTDGINNCIGGDAYKIRMDDTSIGTYYDPNWVPGPTHDYYGNINIFYKTDANGNSIPVDSLGNPHPLN